MTALFAGSFDPPSLGHLDIILRASKLVDHLIVGVAYRLEKKSFLTIDEKLMLLKQMIKELPNVEVVSYQGLTTDFALKNKASHLIRGLRLTTDVHDDFQMALANRKISGLETLFVMGGEQYSHISSTLIREIGRSGASLKDFVTSEVEEGLKRAFARLR